jgi:predicted aspartyl protease
MLRGTINLSQGREKKAFEDFTEAISVNHSNNSLRCLSLTNRGVAFVNKGDLESGLRDLNRAVATDSKSSFALAARGLAHLRADKIDLARRDSEQAMAMNPDPSAAKIAEKILRELSVSQSGPQRLTVGLNDNGQVFVQVRFGKHGAPHRFLVDTGATHSVISTKLLNEISRETKVVELGKSRVTLADGSVRAVTRYRVKDAFLFHLPLGDIEVHVFDRKSRGGLNLLGTRSLGSVSISIDNAGRKAEIARR